jgi:hypothetical protein
LWISRFLQPGSKDTLLMQTSPEETVDLRGILRPRNVFKEIKKVTLLIRPQLNFELVSIVYHDIIKLFQGDYAGYLKCDTNYHNLHHTQECVLEMARLMHGTSLNGYYFSDNDINLGLISAIMHDTGYIKTIIERSGTGGKFTLVHIDRSISFMERYLTEREFSLKDIQFCSNCLRCTGLTVKINKIKFISRENELMGKMLGTADLVGQMTDPQYLQKLPNLFKEFREAGLDMYEDEFDLLKKTPGFWEFTKDRFATELGGMNRFLRDHFRVRWGIDRDVARESIEKNISCLKSILQHHRQDYRRFLKLQDPAAFSGDDPSLSSS